MNSAAARAASRRGTSTRTCPVHHRSPRSAGATRVVLPAPGGAISSARVFPRRASSKSGRTASMGRDTALFGDGLYRPTKIAVEPGDGALADIEHVLGCADAVSLVGIDDQAHRHVHRLKGVPIFDRLCGRHLDVPFP